MNQDIVIYKKAKGRVRAHLLFYPIALLAFFVFTLFVLGQDILFDPAFSKLFFALAIGQIAIFILLFIFLAFGNKWVRWLYWLVMVLVYAQLLIPVYFAIQDIAHITLYGKYLFCMLLKTIFLTQVGVYLFKNSYCRTFYNKTIEINGDEYELEFDYEPDPEPEPDIMLSSYDLEEEEEEIIYTKPQIAYRLGICIYASLVLFPAFCQIFNGIFVSMDMQSSFAAKEIFIHCIFSAFIWTIPVFYLYYNQPNSKKCILACIGCEFVTILWYLYRLKAFLDSDLYSIRVFILFILLDIIRYIVIAHFLKPVFTQTSN